MPLGTGDTIDTDNAMALRSANEAQRPHRATNLDMNRPAVNTAAVITYAAHPGYRHCIDGIIWSYNAVPTGGFLRVNSPAVNASFYVDITVGGVGFIPVKRKGPPGAPMIITLAAGGAAVIGSVNAANYWEEAG